MIKQVIRLMQPGVFLPQFSTEDWPENAALVRPTWMSICAADQRYFQGSRPEQVLRSKLPMALIHEAVGEILYDPTDSYPRGAKVALVPGVPSDTSAVTLREPSGVYQSTHSTSTRKKRAENYREGNLFYSSSCDGFAQEFLSLPLSQLVKIEGNDEHIYAFAELVSVCIHAVQRWLRIVQGNKRGKVGVWGDGPFGYILVLVLRHAVPDVELIVFGKHDDKLHFFSFADDTINIYSKSKCRVGHAFECVGGRGSSHAIDDIIDRIYPMGCITLLGVSESPPPIRTRMILEKGLLLHGCSRSVYSDFSAAVDLISRPAFQGHLKKMIVHEATIRDARDLEKAFLADDAVPFKSLLRWMI